MGSHIFYTILYFWLTNISLTPVRYLKTACQVAASDVVGIDHRQYYMAEVLKIAQTETGMGK